MGIVFTFSSSGLWTGDPDPALSKSIPPFTHTSLITWKTQVNSVLANEVTVHIRLDEGVHPIDEGVYQD